MPSRGSPPVPDAAPADTTPTLTIVVPVYCNSETLEDLRRLTMERFADRLGPGELELIFVDDGSYDDSLDVLTQMAAEHADHVRVLRLSRNFGSQAAILAGMSKSRGRYLAMIGADLQESPDLVAKMLDRAERENAEVVLAVREARDEALSKVAFANLYYWIMRTFTSARFPKGGFDCFLLKRNVVDSIVDISELNTSVPALILWMGFRQSIETYTKVERAAGTSKWTLSKKVRLVLDSVVSFSHTPILFVEGAGVLTASIGLLYALYIVVARIAGWLPEVEGWASLMVALLILSGVGMVSLGVIGEYLWRILDAARGRPAFVIAESYNLGVEEVGGTPEDARADDARRDDSRRDDDRPGND